MTCAETIQTVINAFDWSSVDYGSTPPTMIVGIDDQSRFPKDNYIKLTDDGEEPDFTVDGRYIQSPRYCMLELKERNTTKRTNLYEGLKECFRQSSSCITFANVKPKNLKQPYQINLRVRLL